jgi:hypothetical protein
MTKDQFGTWEVVVPPTAPGVCAIPHDSKLKARLTVPRDARALSADAQISLIHDHVRIERVPAWIQRVTQDIAVSPSYDARFWNPPAAARYTFKHARPPKPTSVRIYEAHVGISTHEHRIGTYKEFTANMLPRIRDLGYNTIQLMAVMEHAYYACESRGRPARRARELTRRSVRLPDHELLRGKLAVRDARGPQGAHRHRARDGPHRAARHRALARVQERARRPERVRRHGPPLLPRGRARPARTLGLAPLQLRPPRGPPLPALQPPLLARRVQVRRLPLRRRHEHDVPPPRHGRRLLGRVPRVLWARGRPRGGRVPDAGGSPAL